MILVSPEFGLPNLESRRSIISSVSGLRRLWILRLIAGICCCALPAVAVTGGDILPNGPGQPRAC